MSDFTVIIPARFASTRFPGKPLVDIHGKTMVQRVYEQAKQSSAIRVCIATDDSRIFDHVESFGGEVILTGANHVSGTDRLQEAANLLNLDDQHIVVNVQGDEPMIPPSVIDQVARNLAGAKDALAATLAEPIDSVDDFLNPNIVKVVADQEGYAHYFSRAPIPWPRDAFAKEKVLPKNYPCLRHLGIYAYRVSLLNLFVSWPVSLLERYESLEQLRIIDHGKKIHIETSCEPVPGGIDTPEDLEKLRAFLR